MASDSKSAVKTSKTPKLNASGSIPPWKPGVSGNPGGRPKGWAEARSAAREHSVDALKKIVKLMNEAEDERVQAMCAMRIRDEAWGKPTTVDVIEAADQRELDRELEAMSDEQLMAIAGVKPS